MNGLLTAHFEKILRGDASAADDYCDNLTCIARAGRRPVTLDCAGARSLLTNLLEQAAFQEPQVLVNRMTENYGVLAVQSGFAPFLCYACIVKEGKIAGATWYIYRPVHGIMPSGVSMPGCKEAGKVFGKHFRAMFSMKARVITKDYAENGVVITNMAKGVCDGKPQIYAFCDHLMKNSWGLMKQLDFHGITSVRWKKLSAGDGLLLFTMEAPRMHMVMTETYWVQDGKIRFECSIAHGAMLDRICELLAVNSDVQ